MSEQKTSLFRHKLELLILTESEEVLNRARQVIAAHYLTYKKLPFEKVATDTLGELNKAVLVVLAQETEEGLKDFAVRVEQALKFFPRSKFIAVMAPGHSRENLEGTQNARVTALSQHEFFSTLKFEYLCVYRCRSQYFEVQLKDFFPMTTMLAPCYVRLPLNQRYLAVIHGNAVLTETRVQRLEQYKELFIRVGDSSKYYEYINNYYDSSGAALRKKARALFLAVYYYSLALNEHILFDFKSAPDSQIEEIYAALLGIANPLLEIMKSKEDLWEIFREAHNNEIAPFWRGPWIAVYATLMAVRSGVGDPLVTLMSGLLMDVGLYDLDEDTARAYLLSEDKKLAPNMLSSFEKHPLLSLNRSLIKKVPINDAIKSVIVCTHEKSNESGFPNQVPTDKLPVEAQLLMFAERVDQEVLTVMKKNGVGFRFLKEKYWESEKTSGQNFSEEFLTAIAEALL
ncbi:hypothetical protein AZI86_15095 [Bdellovibrio bacteriovorus]|uniref:HD-GYP domain-containing protein n=1 Tax=Bdellovibrio bacteriovorus TaxID=959 RepID=A0A150WK74_BDEBC|nr:hypothetical protein [Bdellovibrio bacteriovorus]KYG64122.1 hypothetical protein AZI86_15095 [Bdellovibrio bacteriovorus]